MCVYVYSIFNDDMKLFVVGFFNHRSNDIYNKKKKKRNESRYIWKL